MVIKRVFKIVWNVFSIVWYNMEIQVLKLTDWLEDYRKEFKRSVEYLDKPRYIVSEYKDDYKVEDYVKDDKPRHKPYNGPVCETP
jgi:hypothetical protein